MDGEQRINEFLTKACYFISDEKRADDLKDELKDHLESKINDLMATGKEYDQAAEQAVLEMGDVYKLSKTYEVKPKIHLLRNMGIYLTMLIFHLVLSTAIMFYAQDRIFLIACEVMMITLYGVEAKRYIKGVKSLKSCEKEEAQFYIRGYQDGPNAWAKKAVGIILVAAIAFTVLIAWSGVIDGESFTDILEDIIGFSITDLYILITAICHLDKQAGIVYEDGILIDDGFLKFEHIRAYKWNKIMHKGKAYYNLQLKYNDQKKEPFLPRAKSMPISEKQKAQIESLMEEHDISYSVYI